MKSHTPNYEATATTSTIPESSCSNIVLNGDFESGWVRPWKYVYAHTSDLPGWTVTQGSVDFGDYKTGGHCNAKPCAHGGKAFLDMCGGSRGAIAQTLRTTPKTVYVLKLAYDAHATCSNKDTVMRMDVLIDGKSVKRLRHKNERTWDLDWTEFSYKFKASGYSARLEFKSVNSGCGCMVLDDVTVRPRECGVLTSTPAPICAGGWTLLNGKCARRFGLDPKDRKEWEQAEQKCVSKGGHLASVANAKELKALAQFCFRGLQPDWTIDCAVGLRRASDGAFVWTDGLPFNSELAKEPHMSGHREDHMHIEGHHFDMLEGDYDGGRGPYLYVCGTSLLSKWACRSHIDCSRARARTCTHARAYTHSLNHLRACALFLLMHVDSVSNV